MKRVDTRLNPFLFTMTFVLRHLCPSSLELAPLPEHLLLFINNDLWQRFALIEARKQTCNYTRI